MTGIITVVGKDKVGITAKVCTYLSDEGLNILDISQTIVNGYFNMMMIVDMAKSAHPFEQHVDALNKLGQDIGVVIHLQHEDIFNIMHRV